MATTLKKTRTSNQETLSVYSGNRTTTWPPAPPGHSTLEIQRTFDPTRWKDVPVDKNYLVPPYHWHWYQDEYFDIKKGYVCCEVIIMKEGVDERMNGADRE